MSGRLTITAAVLVGFLAAGTVGCVSRDEYNKAVAASQRANEELLKSQSALQAVRADNQKLRDDLNARDAALAAKDKTVANLKQAHEDLLADFKKLDALYKKAVDREVTVAGANISILPIRMDAALRALVKTNPEMMDYLPEYGMIKLKADLTFAKGSVSVKPDAVAALGKLAEIVNTDEAETFHVYVAGHTDDIPLVKPETIRAHQSNWGLSLHRAGAVVKVLAASGVAQLRMGAMGFSKYHPVAPNKAGNKGNPLNRRVEIWIVPPDRFLTSSSEVQSEK
ncbi:MAG: OmpA family protein [Planctomycetota bacterium]|nr:OmpA family protein [Planctomycetota bacterium]